MAVVVGQFNNYSEANHVAANIFVENSRIAINLVFAHFRRHVFATMNRPHELILWMRNERYPNRFFGEIFICRKLVGQTLVPRPMLVCVCAKYVFCPNSKLVNVMQIKFKVGSSWLVMHYSWLMKWKRERTRRSRAKSSQLEMNAEPCI